MTIQTDKSGKFIERIDELRIRLKSAPPMTAASADFGTVAARGVYVTLHFNYRPGHPGNLYGRMEDAEEPTPAELDIVAITAYGDAHFDGEYTSLTATKGTDLMPLFTAAQIEALEDKLLAQAGKNNQ